MPSCSRLRYLESHPRTSAAWPADRPPAGTLVLLHAFPLGARMWEPQHLLCELGWRVVMPQLRGFDCEKADGADAASIDDYASDIADLMETLDIDEAVIGGLSMGGYIALALYRHAPELFRGLVLADTRADADAAEARANRTRMIELAATGGTEAVADAMLPRLLGATTFASQPALAERVRLLMLANAPTAIQAALRAMMTRSDSTVLLGSIAVPALIIVGDEDTLTPPSVSSSMADAIPAAELVVLPRAGHLSNMEQPQLFNAALLRFLVRLYS